LVSGQNLECQSHLSGWYCFIFRDHGLQPKKSSTPKHLALSK
jgi:hypothetical protein